MGYMDGFYREVERVGVVPVVVLDRVEDALPVADVLVKGGLPSAEVTFRTACAADAIHEMSEKCPDLLVGAGTVLNLEQARRAVDAGARYIISPNTDEKVIRRTRELGLVSIPGAFTPTEISGAYQFGADFVKLFPVSALGPAYIKAIRAPLCHIPLIAVGGISSANMHEYIAAGCAAVGVGGNLANLSLIRSGAFDRIEQLARSYADAESPPHP